MADFSFPTKINEEGVTINEIRFLKTLIDYLSSSERTRPSFLMVEYSIVADVVEKLQHTIDTVDKKVEDGVEETKESEEKDKTMKVGDLFTLKNILEICSKRNCFELKQYNAVVDVYARLLGSIEKAKQPVESNAL